MCCVVRAEFECVYVSVNIVEEITQENEGFDGAEMTTRMASSFWWQADDDTPQLHTGRQCVVAFGADQLGLFCSRRKPTSI